MKRQLTLVGTLPPWRRARKEPASDIESSYDVEPQESDHPESEIDVEIDATANHVFVDPQTGFFDADDAPCAQRYDWMHSFIPEQGVGTAVDHQCTSCGARPPGSTALHASIHTDNVDSLFCEACHDAECLESHFPYCTLYCEACHDEEVYAEYMAVDEDGDQGSEDGDEHHDDDQDQESDDVECQLAFNENAMTKMITNAENENAEGENENENAAQGPTPPNAPPTLAQYQKQWRGHLYKTPPRPPQGPPTLADMEAHGKGHLYHLPEPCRHQESMSAQRTTRVHTTLFY